MAKFNANLSGQWTALVSGTIGVDGVALRDNPNFAGGDDEEVLAKILIKTRMAADAVGATMMDRPEWTGARPRIGGFDEVEIYCTLTNNNRRGVRLRRAATRLTGSPRQARPGLPWTPRTRVRITSTVISSAGARLASR